MLINIIFPEKLHFLTAKTIYWDLFIFFTVLNSIENGA